MSLERSWTTNINIVGRKAPLGEDLGLIPMLAIPLWTGAVAVAAALGYGTYQTVFGTNQATFEEGWQKGSVFDQRMAAIHELWLKFDQQIQLKCPAFVKKDGGAWWRQFKADLNEFGAFYASVGTHPGYFTGWSSSVAGGQQIGGAISRLNSLIGWGQAVEQTCPGTFPGLGILAPSDVEKAAAAQRAADAAAGGGTFGSNFGSNLGVTLGLGALGLLAFMWVSSRITTMPLQGFQGVRRSRRVSRSRWR